MPKQVLGNNIIPGLYWPFFCSSRSISIMVMVKKWFFFKLQNSFFLYFIVYYKGSCTEIIKLLPSISPPPSQHNSLKYSWINHINKLTILTTISAAAMFLQPVLVLMIHSSRRSEPFHRHQRNCRQLLIMMQKTPPPNRKAVMILSRQN